MEKKKSLVNYVIGVIAIFVIAINVNFTQTVEASASGNDIWNVSCDYGPEGTLISANCTSNGIRACKCPKSVLEED